MYLVQIIDAHIKNLNGSIWDIDEKGENAICIDPKNSEYCTNIKINTEKLGTYTSKRLERIDEQCNKIQVQIW